MAGYFKKRKRNAGPNKNEAKVSRGKEIESLGMSGNSLASRYPTVLRLSIKLNFLSRQGHVLGEDTRAFGPQDSCDFSAPCPGSCGVGDFNLAAKIASVVANRQPVFESKGVCQQRLFAGSNDVCGCQLSCRGEVSYAPIPAAAAPPEG